MLEQILTAIEEIRSPIAQAEYDLHDAVDAVLTAHGIEHIHEAKLGPHCRVDFLCGTIAIEIKKGKPSPAALRTQLKRYLSCDTVSEIIVITQYAVSLPNTIQGKRVTELSLNRLWGIALP